MKKLVIIAIFMIIAASSVLSQTKLATNFSLKNVDGNTISLSDFKSEKGVIVIFVSNGCPVSEEYQPRIEALQKKYAAKGFPVVAIDPVDSFSEMAEVAKSRSYSYFFLHDSTQKIASKYKVSFNTHAFLLLPTKKGFKVIYEGGIDNDYTGEKITEKYLENAVDAVLNKKTISVKKTKVVGCPINYRQ
jgi:thiol-disulfide isomerase/thioredoxin